MTAKDDPAALVEKMTKRLADEGRLIEAGWQAMRLMVLPPTAPKVQLVEMRKAYFTGAQHAFASLIGLVGNDDGEPTADELRRVEQIHHELEGFVGELRRELDQGPARPDLPNLHGDDPRQAGGDISGPGGPHDMDGVVVDTTNAVLLSNSTVTIVEAARRGEARREPVVALMLEGRINKAPTRTRVLYMMNGDGAAAIVTELLGIAKRAERQGAPELVAEFKAQLGERWDEMPT